jgi:hypothetical protein
MKLKSLLQEKIARADLENVEFMSGINMGVQDKKQNTNRSLSGYPPDFVRGYKMVKRESWWSKANDKLTQWAAQMGQSYGKRE